MIHIVGGTYEEECLEPRRSLLFGSGVRAAAAISNLSKRVRLYTYADSPSLKNLQIVRDTFGFELEVRSVPNLVRFSYLHGLAQPTITPPRDRIRQQRPIEIDAENILQFGMMEGEGLAHGKKVVYDPQSIANPKHFVETGSSAEELSILCNWNEAKLLTGEDEIRSMCSALGKRNKAKVVIIKMGIGGAFMWNRNRLRPIPAHVTSSVWPIGTGDVFAAVFAHFWMEERTSAFVAALSASKAVALYSSSEVLPIQKKSLTKFVTTKSIKPTVSRPRKRKSVYLAGPFFTMSQRWIISEVRRYLQGPNLAVFSPYHEIGIGLARKVVPQDIKALKRSNLVFAIVDGLDPGTLFEIGYARSLGIPVVAFVQNEMEDHLKMLSGTDCVVFHDFVSAIYNAAWMMHS